LAEVGLDDIRFARNHGTQVDSLRKTSYSENVQQLRVIAKKIMDFRRHKTKKGDVIRGPTSKRGYPAPGIENRQKND
jgi:hypothetical protein